jgi:hypothetical protein
MNDLEKYYKILKEYNINVVEDFFYILFNCIDSSINKYKALDKMLKKNPNYEKIKEIYKGFYYYIIDYLKSLDISRELSLHTQIINLVDTLLQIDKEYIENNISVIMSDIVDLIFFKYKLNISKFNKNEDIKNYLNNKIDDKNIVDLLYMLLLSTTSLKLEYVQKIPEEDLDNIVKTIILVSLYICNKDKNERNSKTDS